MRHALAALAIAVAAALTASAQTHAHGTPQVAPPPDGSSVTATGCLARGDAAKTFVLKNVTWQSTNVPSAQASGHAHGAPPPAGAPAANAPGETLRLGGAASTLKLDAHVGHTISATGTIAKRDPVVTPGIVLPDPQPQGDTTSRTRDAEVRASAAQRTLNMRSMAHVAAECK
jgi:hypothetical protein